MKKIRYIFTIATIMLAIPLTVKGETAEQVIADIISTYNNNLIVTGDYIVTYNGTNSTGTIAMSREKFSIVSDDLKCWYDGKTQWSYLSQIEEVNIIEPTTQELAMTNPYAALQNIDNNFKAELIGSDTDYLIKLTPIGAFDLASDIELTIDKSTKLIVKALFINQDDGDYIITISNYNTISNYSDATFTYDPSQLPAGTPVIDLR